MKKLLLLSCIIATLLCVSCGKETPKTELRDFTEALMTQYPNYESNDIAKAKVNEAVKEKAQSLLNQPTTFFNGVEFRFIDLMETENGYSVFLESSEFCEIDAPKDSRNKYESTSAIAQVVGNIDESTAASLDKNKNYFISGTIEGWVEKPLPHLLSHCAIFGVSIDGICFGAFSVKDLKLTEAPKDK